MRVRVLLLVTLLMVCVAAGAEAMRFASAPHIGVSEAKSALGDLLLNDVRDMGLPAKLSRCAHTSEVRVRCTATLRLPGTRCRTYSIAKTETIDGEEYYSVYVGHFTCKPRE